MQKTSESTWSQYVSIRSRFQRSVHLQRDAKGPDWLAGYIVTPLTRSILTRIGHGLRPGGTARSWSITGPYGSGKSAFALFLSQLMATEEVGASKAARSLLSKSDSKLKNALFGARGVLPGNESALIPVLATGERRALEAILLDALWDSANRFWDSGKRPDILDELADVANAANDGELPSTSEVVSLFDRVAEQVRASKRPGSGLVVVLDEAGKALEHIVTSRGRSDIHLMQELAELANRSGDTPILFVVMLHQAFENYAARLSAAHRNEWMKVQGRFEDVPFQEPADQVLRLISAAMEKADLPPAAARAANETAQAVAELCSDQLVERSKDLVGSLEATAPLHPTTALALGPLFRSRLAQNERSLFAFLGSSEPRGFQEFINRTLVDQADSLFSLADLYDYVIATYGGRLYSSHARVWAQMDTALHRLPPDAQEVDARVVKVVGLLGVLGEATGLAPNRETIHQAIWQGKAKKKDTKEAIERLQRASILIYRKFKDAYQLWDGSDLDLDGLIDKAKVDTSPYANLATRLARIAPPRPLVARRHFHETGAFRYFEVRYADERLVLEDREFVPEGCQADGVLWIVLPTSESAEAQVDRALGQAATWNVVPNPKPVLVGLPASRSKLVTLLDDLAAIEAVEANTAELQSDPVARRELAGRRDETLHLLRSELQQIMTTGGNARWYAKQYIHAQDVDTNSLTLTLSAMCSAAYSEAPKIKNELVHRGTLSSAAAAARRVLMTSMVEAPKKSQLGITGHPPELSMYRSLLEVHGLHEEVDGEWQLTPPRRDVSSGSLRPAWDALHEFLSTRGDQRVNLESLYAHLAAPPFGMKLGVLPVLALHYALVHHREIGLFEDGTFYPEIDAPFIERMLRSPKSIELQLIRVSRSREALAEQMTPIVLGPDADRKASTLEVARFLMLAASELPDFARQTKELPKPTLRLRAVLLHAKDPARLIYRQLPEALGLEALDSKSAKDDPELANKLIKATRRALRQLYSAYPKLLAGLREAIATTFQTESSEADVREALAPRASLKLPKGANNTLRAFMGRVQETEQPLEEWTEALATLLVGKPPKYWYDRDRDEYLLRLGNLAVEFAEMESLAIASGDSADSTIQPLQRLSIRKSDGTEAHRVIPTPESMGPEEKRLLKQLRAQLKSESKSLSKDQQLAVLSSLCESLIKTN